MDLSLNFHDGLETKLNDKHQIQNEKSIRSGTCAVLQLLPTTSDAVIVLMEGNIFLFHLFTFFGVIPNGWMNEEIFFLLCWNNSKQRSELSTLCCFWFTVSKCSRHFENSFPKDKCSFKIGTTLPTDIHTVLAISCNFILRTTKASLWTSLYLLVKRIWVFKISSACRPLKSENQHPH